MEERTRDLYKYAELLLEMKKNGLDVEDKIQEILGKLDSEINVAEEPLNKRPVDIIVLENSICAIESTIEYFERLLGKPAYRKKFRNMEVVEFGNVKISAYVLNEYNYQTTIDSKLRGMRTDYLINNSDLDINDSLIGVTIKNFR